MLPARFSTTRLKTATLLAACFILPRYSQSAATWQSAAEFTSFPLSGKAEHLLSETDAKFTRGQNEWVWISDAEHIVWDQDGQHFLADSTHPVCLARDRIPSKRKFELFPYHYYRHNDYVALGNRPLNYELIAQNETSAPVTLTIFGKGTTRDWNHYKAWQGALACDGATTVSIPPGQSYTFWKAIALQPDLPWSAVVFGQADADLTISDYCYISKSPPDPGTLDQMPDLAWPPYLLASFTRGCADWFTARIQLFPAHRTGAALGLSGLLPSVQSAALAYSPGGPITHLSEYKSVAPTFAADSMMVRDPVSSYSHQFFGGNYPVIYDASTEFLNDTTQTATVRLWICSNDRFNVDSIIGVWNPKTKTMLSARVPSIQKNNRWNPVSITLAPGKRETMDALLVPLGSRWGGFIASWEIETTKGHQP